MLHIISRPCSLLTSTQKPVVDHFNHLQLTAFPDVYILAHNIRLRSDPKLFRLMDAVSDRVVCTIAWPTLFIFRSDSNDTPYALIVWWSPDATCCLTKVDFENFLCTISTKQKKYGSNDWYLARDLWNNKISWATSKYKNKNRVVLKLF